MQIDEARRSIGRRVTYSYKVKGLPSMEGRIRAVADHGTSKAVLVEFSESVMWASPQYLRLVPAES